MQNAKAFLLDHFPSAAFVELAHDIRDDLRLDTFLVDHGSEAEVYTVVSVRIDGVFIPETLGSLRHIPYEIDLREARPPHDEAVGVFVTIEPAYTQNATRAKFSHRGDILETAVTNGHAVLYTWDTIWPRTADQPRPVALEQAGVWQAVVPGLLALPDDFARAYAAYAGSKDHQNWWAVSAFFDARDWDERFTLAMAILDRIDLLDDRHFGGFGAGPIEDLLCHELMDVAEADTGRTETWRSLLHATYWHLEPEDVRQRVARFLGQTA